MRKKNRIVWCIAAQFDLPLYGKSRTKLQKNIQKLDAHTWPSYWRLHEDTNMINHPNQKAPQMFFFPKKNTKTHNYNNIKNPVSLHEVNMSELWSSTELNINNKVHSRVIVDLQCHKNPTCNFNFDIWNLQFLTYDHPIKLISGISLNPNPCKDLKYGGYF